MKKTILAAAIALSGLAAFTSANAQSYTQGDSLLLFRIDQSASTNTTGYSINVAIDLGNINNAGPISYNFTPSALAAVLDASFGSGWYNNANAWAGIIGTSSNSTTTSFQSTDSPLLLGNDWSYLNSYNGQMVSAFKTGTITSVVDSLGGSHWASILSIATGAGFASGFSFYDDSNFPNNWAGFNGLLPGGISQDLLASDSNNPVIYSVNTYFKAPNNVNDANNGTVTIDSTGSISVSTVPEPSTYFLAGIGALALVIFLRRRNA